MDLSQKKLNKDEWEAVEVPLSSYEKNILSIIKDGYENVNIKKNNALSLMAFMKFNKDFYHPYFYNTYFKKIIQDLIKKYNLSPYEKKFKKKINLKKADKIRIENSSSKMDDIKNNIYEFILLKLVNKMSKKRKPLYYYTIHQLLKYSIEYLNPYVIEFITIVLQDFKSAMNKTHFIKNAQKYMERNEILEKWRDVTLYSHQKQLFTYCKDPNPKLILYQAPTGTGKTVSPIGLSQGHKLIFVCAAKHVGLQLAKSCVGMGLPIAIAFGCEDPSDIRLHYYAVKDFVRNRRTGGIFRVDNSAGDKVQIIISDIQSYLPAMYYMLSFNEKEDIIWYWDEPTITLDYENHKYHDLLKRNWRENQIPNVILSSATLPRKDDIMPCIQYHRSRFPKSEIYCITSYECRKGIPMIDKDGYHILPHYRYENYEDIKIVVKHLIEHKTILRHFDLKEIVAFILYVNEKDMIKSQYTIDEYFETILEIDIMAIKEYYLKILQNVETNYSQIYTYFQEKRKRFLDSSVYVTTKDAHTLTDGPTIFLVNDVEKVADFCLRGAHIPQGELDIILKNLKINDKLQKQISTLRQVVEQIESENKESPQRKELEGLYTQIKTIQLDRKYVPNSFSHLRRWNQEGQKNAFTSDISEDDVEKIISLPILDTWKILLLMGIGVFKNHKCVFYSEIMKKLAEEQKLYLIIASSDYIYGTNYQFCHGYLGKDLADITQEKIIQAFGRIGRSNVAQNYSIRLRDNSMIDKLLKPAEYKPEVENMNRLFGI